MFLRQSTASQSVAIGPFIDDTDFKTPETALTINNTDIKLVVNGGASANKNSGGGTHRVNGVYGVTFDATDTATVGEVEVSVVVSGALPVFHKFQVVEEAVYDALFAGSALGYVANATVNVAQISGDSAAADNAEAFFDGTGYAGTNNVIPTVTTVTNQVTANVTAISGDTAAADNLEAAADGTGYNLGGGAVVAASVTGNVGGTVNGFTAVALADFFDTNSGTTYASAVAGSVVKEIVDNASGGGGGGAVFATGTVTSATSTTTLLDANSLATAGFYVGARLRISAGTGSGQERIITDYTAGRVATHAEWVTTPDNTSTYIIEPARTSLANADSTSLVFSGAAGASEIAICNMALSHLGVAKEIANLETENSQEASACRRFFAQARDNTLRDYPWPFATKITTLALVEADPNEEWGYSYRAPTDFLRINRILSGVRNDSARTRVPYRIVRDESGLLIYTDKEDAEIEYVMRETDPSRYPGDFTMALSLRLAAYIAPRLTAGDPYKLGERALRLHSLEISKAEATSVNEEQAEEAPESEMVDER